MIIKLFEDKEGNPIDTQKVYTDEKNKVNDIKIIEIDGDYYAKPNGLDEEPLGSVCGGLVEQQQ